MLCVGLGAFCVYRVCRIHITSVWMPPPRWSGCVVGGETALIPGRHLMTCKFVCERGGVGCVVSDMCVRSSGEGVGLRSVAGKCVVGLVALAFNTW